MHAVSAARVRVACRCRQAEQDAGKAFDLLDVSTVILTASGRTLVEAADKHHVTVRSRD